MLNRTCAAATRTSARGRRVVVRITDGVGKGLDAKVTSQAIVSP